MLHWGVYFLIVSVVFRNLGTINIAFLTLNQVIIIALFFSTFLVRTLRGQRIFLIGGLEIALLLFGFYFWISNFLINQDPSWGLHACINYFRSLMFYFVIAHVIDTRKKINMFLTTYIASSLTMVLTANVFEMLRSGLTINLFGGRTGLSGLAEHYIKYAQYALMSIPLAHCAMKNVQKGTLKIFYSAIASVLSIAVLFSGSRGAIVTFIVMGCAMAAIELRQSDHLNIALKRAFLIVVVGMGAFFLFWAKGGSQLFETLFTLFSDNLTDRSLSVRLFIANESFSLFLNNPLFGIGIDSTRHIYGLVTHSQWLQIMTELGLIGVILALMTVTFFLSYFTVYKKKVL